MYSLWAYTGSASIGGWFNAVLIYTIQIKLKYCASFVHLLCPGDVDLSVQTSGTYLAIKANSGPEIENHFQSPESNTQQNT